jgi:PqqD family protein of HPr-rel-A system
LPECFHWASWENSEESVLFHAASGDTIIVNQLGEFLLKTIINHESSTHQLAEAAAKSFGFELDDEWISMIYQHLISLEKPGLIRPKLQ